MVSGVGFRVGGWGLKRFRGGLVFKAHRLVYHSTLGWRVIKKRRRSVGFRVEGWGFRVWGLGFRVSDREERA